MVAEVERPVTAPFARKCPGCRRRRWWLPRCLVQGCQHGSTFPTVTPRSGRRGACSCLCSTIRCLRGGYVLVLAGAAAAPTCRNPRSRASIPHTCLGDVIHASSLLRHARRMQTHGRRAGWVWVTFPWASYMYRPKGGRACLLLDLGQLRMNGVCNRAEVEGSCMRFVSRPVDRQVAIS